MKYTLFCCAILLMSCHQPNKPIKFPIPRKDNINAIVKAIVDNDSLLNQNELLSVDLQKLHVIVTKNRLNLPPPPYVHDINIHELIDSAYIDGCFSKSDSTYLIFQNDTIKAFKIDTTLVSFIKFTHQPIEQRIEKFSKYSAHYLKLSIPIFSTDQRTAYVSFDYYCPRCGSGGFFIMQKVNGTWQVIKRIKTWAS